MNKVLVVTGSAPCVNQDIDALLEHVRVEDCDFMAIGIDAINKHSHPLLFLATYHWNDIDSAKQKRAKSIGRVDFKIIHHEKKPGVDIVEPYEKPSGSSSLLGTLAGLRMGYEKIVLCGCPLIGLDGQKHNYSKFQLGWVKKKDTVIGKVKSMSGWTSEFLGTPMEDWLE